MPLFMQDMSKVEDWGAVLPEQWYRVRIEKGELRESKESGNQVWAVWFKVQDEPHIGRVIFDQFSLQAHALAGLKALYKACDYVPGPEGHDPEKINGAELYIRPEHEMYEGVKRMKVKPWNIRRLQDGPGA